MNRRDARLELSRRPTDPAGRCELATATWGDAVPTIVMLHDGLGSISQWRDVPARIAEATGATVLAYDRPGHGSSTPVPIGPWPAQWLHHEAERLVDLLSTLGIDRPLLVGHSDGGSIALIAAMNGLDVVGIVSIAAHTWVEQICRDSIVGMRADVDRFVAGLARHHDHPAAVFEAWSGVWVSEEFGRWDLRPDLHAIGVPTVIAQGDADEYATAAMVTDSVDAIGANARGVFIPGGRHIVHHHDPDAVVELVSTSAASFGVDDRRS